MVSSFQRRSLTLTFKLNAGTFDDAKGADTLILSGLRVVAEIDSFGDVQSDECRLRIFGMTQEHMNRLSFRWYAMDVPQNFITVAASTGTGADAVIFRGSIVYAQADYTGAPDVVFEVQATNNAYAQVLPGKARSFRGSVPVQTILTSIADQLGASVVNNGVKTTLHNCVLRGSLNDQMMMVKKHANIELSYEPPIIYIYPRNGKRRDGVFEMNSTTGMVGWPNVDVWGIQLTSLFNPSLQRGVVINVSTSVVAAAGKWYIYSIQQRLESERPGGAWFTHISARTDFNPNVAPA